MTATISHAVYATPADTYTQVNNAFTASAGWWSLVEEVVSGTSAASVWRSTSTPVFHLVVMRSTAGVQLSVCEGYNATTHAMIRPVVESAYGNTAAPNADFSVGPQEFVMFTAPAVWNVNVIRTVLRAVVGTPVSVGVTPRGVTFGFSSATPANYVFSYLGLFDTLASVADVAPVILADRVAGCRVTRYPNVTALQAGNWSAVATPWTPKSGNINGGTDRLQGSRVVGSRLLLTHSATQPELFGGMRGLLPSFLLEFSSLTAPGVGDVVVVGAKTYEIVGFGVAGSNVVHALDRAAA